MKASARDPVARCIWILEEMRLRKSVRLDDLAMALSVSKRTLSRDLSALRAAGARIDPEHVGGRFAGLRFRGIDLDMACVRSAS